MPEKHRSVRSVFNQSWALLSPSEQAVFKRLSVFCGGFRRQAAEQIAGASLVSLSALVDKSLVRWEPDGRYQIHELLRQYAAEQLEQSAQDVAQVYDLHCKYYTDFLGERAGALMGGRQREALLEIEAELENIRAAWQWAVEQGKVEPIRKSAEVLTLFYDFRGRYLEGIRALEEACRQLRGQESNQETVLALALLWVNLGGLYIRVGRLEEAETVLNESQALYHQLDTLPPPGFATDPAFMLGIVASIRGNYAEAARLGEQARQTSEAQHHLSNQQAAYYLLGRAAFLQGQVKLSQEYIQQAYALSEKLKDRWFMAYCLNELGSIACALRQYETAREYYAASYEIRKEFNDPEGMAVALNYLGQIAAWQENYAEAEQLFQRSLTISQEINNRGGVAAALNGLGRAALSQGNYQTGREWFSQALRVAREGQFVSLILSLLVGVSELLIETGRPEQGQELLVLALNHPGSEHETREQARQKLSHYQLDLTPDQATPGSQPTTWSDLETVVVRLLADLSAWARPGEESRDEMEAVKSPLVFSPTGQPALVEPLTEREIEVLHLLAEGLSNVEIAERLVLAVGTVKYYTSEIYGKLGVRNRTEAAARARELGLL
jgi:DNA-binding CsgD family transcriptional regulator/tetratricopeptide (TPR) repeat protein